MSESVNPRSTLGHLGAILIATGVVFFVHLGTPALWDEDEPLYAAIALDMYQRGDWIVPRYNGALFAEKPPLAYWLMMFGYWLVGVNEWAVRLPSTVFGVGTGWVVYFLGRRLFQARAGFWAALATTTSIIFTVSARAATTDSVFVFCTTLGIYCFVAGGFVQSKRLPEGPVLAGSPRCPPREGASGESQSAPAASAQADVCPANPWWAWAGMYLCFSLAVLAKGPIGLLLPVGMLALFLLIRRQWESGDRWWAEQRPWLLGRFARPTEEDFLRPGWQVKTLAAMLVSWLVGLAALARTFRPQWVLQAAWQMRPITGLMIVGLVAVPWYVLVGLQTDGEFLRRFFWEQNVLRTMKPMQGHSGPVWYYIPAILVGFFPWSVFLGPALVELGRGIWSAEGKPGQAKEGSSEQHDRMYKFRLACIFVACWIGVFVAAWSVPRTKLPHYVLTAYPALGLMTGWFIWRWLERPERGARWWMRLALGSLAVAGLGLAGGFPIAAWLFTPGEEWLGLIGLVPVAGAGIFVHFARQGRRQHAMASFALMSVLFLVGIFGLAAVRIDRFQEARPMMAQLRQLADDDFQLAGYQFIRESFVFYAGRTIRYLETPSEVEAFLRESARPFLLSTNKQEADLQSQFGGRLEVILRRPRFLRRGEILLWGRRERACPCLAGRTENLSDR